VQTKQAARLVSVDHVLIVSRDPAAAAEQLFVRTGLAAVPGGEHDGLGTRNLIVPLGDGYLEIVEAHDIVAARANPFGRLVLAGTQRAEDEGLPACLFSWSVSTEDATALAEALNTGSMPLSRAGVSVLLAGVDESISDPSRPFFLQRSAGQESPARRSTHHRVAPVGIRRMTIAVSESWSNWADQMPVGSTELYVEPTTGPVGSRLTKLEIELSDANIVVLTADHPLGVST
jgi:hypothetical protein